MCCCSPGIIQADRVVLGRLSVFPSILAPPSAAESGWSTTVELMYKGPGSGDINLEVVHEPGFAIPLSNGWCDGSLTSQPVLTASTYVFNANLSLPYRMPEASKRADVSKRCGLTICLMQPALLALPLCVRK